MDRTLRIVLSVFGVIIALPIVIYAAALVINWHDRPPSADALAFAAALRDVNDVADADNAYVYLLGYAARRDKDPAVIGAARAAWIRTLHIDPSLPREPDPYPDLDGFRSLYEQIRSLRCDPGAACDETLAGAHDRVSSVLAKQAWVLERYRRLLSYHAWADVPAADLRTTWLAVPSIGATHALYLLDAWSHAQAGDAAAVRDALDADLDFWRLALRESGSLSTKQIVERSIVRQHFLWGNLILRQLPAEVRAAAIPASWRRPLSADERSMARPFRREWDYGRRLALNAKTYGDPFVERELPIAPRLIVAVLISPFMQLQNSANRDAAAFVRLDALLSVPYDELPAALVRARTVVDERPTGVTDTLYDLVGGLLMPRRGDLADEGAQIADLEGVRRAALLTAELRARGVPADGVAAALALDASRNPYTGEPFEWIAARLSVAFTGLQSSPYSHAEFRY